MRAAAQTLRETGRWLTDRESRKVYDAASGANDFLAMLGIFSCAFLWLRLARSAMQSDACDDAFTQRKPVLARYWFEREVPMIAALAQRVRQPAQTLMALDAQAF